MMILLQENMVIKRLTSQRAIGDPNPDFILGWNNSFRIKDVKLGFLLDWREGGRSLEWNSLGFIFLWKKPING